MFIYLNLTGQILFLYIFSKKKGKNIFNYFFDQI